MYFLCTIMESLLPVGCKAKAEYRFVLGFWQLAQGARKGRQGGVIFRVFCLFVCLFYLEKGKQEKGVLKNQQQRLN
jgi:hypothetical protein